VQTIEYRVQFTGAVGNPRAIAGDDGTRSVETEIVRVRAININAGYPKAIAKAREPLGNGQVREIGAIEFWKVA